MIEPTEPVAPPADLSGKSINVTLTRWDLVRLNVGLMTRIRSTWMMGAVMTLATALLSTSLRGLPGTSRAWLVMLLGVALAAAVGATAGLVMAIVLVLFSSDPDTTLGDHVYSFEADGLRDQNPSKDTIVKWGAVRDVRRIGDFILINVAPGLYHALPRRSFSSPGEYQAFWDAAQRLARSAEPALS